MSMSFQPRLHSIPAAFLASAVLLCAGCSTTPRTTLATSQPGTGNKDAVLIKSPTDLSFLLSMSFSEAKSISSQQLEFPPHIKIAADTIEVFKYSDDGKPLKARARGKVFVEMDFAQPAKALCQEAFITNDEIILRGTPILQRGGSMVEGLDESTIFYMFGTSLRVIGLHKVNNQTEITSLLPALGTWAQGPNPLLPPLTEGAVPTNIRDAMQRAAEAEMLHQKTRELYGPADSPPATPQPAPEKSSSDKPKATPPATKKPSAIEVRRAVPNKKSFWSRADRTRA